MRSVFFDTGAWIALLKGNDRYHSSAVAFYRTLTHEPVRFLTSDYVVDETVTRLRYDAGLEAALAFHDALKRAEDERRLRVAWVAPRHHRDAWEVLERYQDVSLSFTDATSVVIARAARAEVFGFDAHFRAVGFVLVPGT